MPARARRPSSSPSTSASPPSPPGDIFRANVSRGTELGVAGQALHGRGGVRPRRGHQPHGAQPHRRARRGARLHARRLPAHPRAGRGARRDDPAHRARAGRRGGPHRRPGRGRRAAAAARRDRGPRRRHRRGDPPSPGDLRRGDRARSSRSTASAGCSSRSTVSARSTRSPSGSSPPSTSSPRADAGPEVFSSNRGLEIKTPAQIDQMRVSGLLVGRTLELLREAARPGVTTGELDRLAETHIRDHGGIPSFKGYSHPPFPATICASVNDEVVHGIPGDRVLQRRRRRLHRLRRHRRRLARRRRAHRAGRRRGPRDPRAAAGHRGGAVARPGGRAPRRAGQRHRPRRRALRALPGAATASSRTTPATASAPRCTWRPTSPTSAGAAGGPTLVEGLALAVEPMVTLGSKDDRPARGRVDRGHRRRLHGRALRAHLHPDPDRGLGADRRRRRERPGSPSWAPPSAVADRRTRTVADVRPRRRPCQTGRSRRGVFPDGGVVSTARVPTRSRCHRLLRPGPAAEETSGACPTPSSDGDDPVYSGGAQHL